MARPGYFIEQTWASLRSSWGLTAMTSLSIGVVLVLMGVYWSVVQSIESLTVVWGRHAAVVAYLHPATVDSRMARVVEQVRALDGVEQVKVVAAAQALKRFADTGEASAALVAGIPESALATSLELELESGLLDSERISALASKIAGLEGVESVDYGREDLEDLRGLVAGLRRAGAWGGLFLLLAAAFLVGNTIRLTVYSRRDEVAVLRLVGASAWFIRLPFVLEGGTWGLLGSASAIGALALFDLLWGAEVQRMVVESTGGMVWHWLTGSLSLTLLAIGPAVGIVGSWLAVGRFIDEADA